MFEEVQVLFHSSIKIAGEKILYFDPYEIAEACHDADMIFITHDHFDHFSSADIEKLLKDGTYLVAPESIASIVKDEFSEIGTDHIKTIAPDGIMEQDGVIIRAVPAYNRTKPFHPWAKKYVGYLVTMGNVTYYIAGDTDITSENRQIKCDVALLPVGGKYTMDYKEAAKLANAIAPKLVIPTHYGSSVVGTPQDGEKFAALVDNGIEVRVML